MDVMCRHFYKLWFLADFMYVFLLFVMFKIWTLTDSVGTL